MDHCNQLLLALMHTPKVGAKTISKLLEQAQQRNLSVDKFLQDSEDVIRLGLKAITSDVLEQGREKSQDLAEQLEAFGIEMLVQGDTMHPASQDVCVTELLPPIIFAKGNNKVLDLPGVAFAGSRNASPKGIEIAVACVKQMVSQSVNIISGYANGVDLAAHQTALEQGGCTTLVLAEGILRFKPKLSLAAVFREEQALILSQFPPRMTWTAGNAMQRNSLILALSYALVVIESGIDGGTWSAAETALRHHLPVFVVDYATPPESALGNRLLLERGARPLRMSRSGEPNLNELREVLGSQRGIAPPAEQGDLFG